VSARLALQICTYLLVVDGLTALALARLIEPAWWALVVAVVAGSWWQEAVRARVAAVVRHQQLLALAALGFFALDLLYLAESLLDGFMHLLLFLFFYKLYTWRTLRDSRDLLLLYDDRHALEIRVASATRAPHHALHKEAQRKERDDKPENKVIDNREVEEAHEPDERERNARVARENKNTHRQEYHHDREAGKDPEVRE